MKLHAHCAVDKQDDVMTPGLEGKKNGLHLIPHCTHHINSSINFPLQNPNLIIKRKSCVINNKFV